MIDARQQGRPEELLGSCGNEEMGEAEEMAAARARRASEAGESGGGSTAEVPGGSGGASGCAEQACNGGHAGRTLIPFF